MNDTDRYTRRQWIFPPNSPSGSKTSIQTILQSIILRSPLIILMIGFFIGFLLSSFWTMAITMTNIPLLHTSDNLINRDDLVNKSLRNLVSDYTFDEVFNTGANTLDDGWKAIHVYVGSSTNSSNKVDHMIEASKIPNDYFHTTKWFSQARQDEVVFHLLRQKTDGYFLDLAANDAIRISNTFALEYYYNWTGIVIEPNPIYWSSLSYRNCTVIAAVVGQRTNQLMKFKFPQHSKPPPQGGLVGPFFDNRDDNNNNNNKNEDVMRYTITLKDIFAKFQVPNVIDYFSLDIEGAETFIMESFPFDLYRFNVLTIERATERLCTILQQNEYQQLKQLKWWGETLWIHTSLLQDNSMIDLSALNIETDNYKYREKA